MYLVNSLKALLLPSLYVLAVIFLGAELFYWFQGYHLSPGYWLGMLFVYALVVAPTVLRNAKRGK
jgi:hypothetical protein